VLQHTPSAQFPLPHSVPAPHAVPLVLVHVPGLDAPLHDLPAPQLAAPQHTPSVQIPLAQLAPVVQLVPSGSSAVHAVPLQ
jgi:hypothetical protein